MMAFDATVISGRALRWMPLLGLLLKTAMAGTAADVPASLTLEKAGQAMGRAQTVFTRFVQERHLSLFNEPLRTEGFLLFQKPGSIRWEMTSPYKSILISDQSGVAQFEWVENQWKKLDIGLAGALQNVVSQIAGVMEGRYTKNQSEYAVTLTEGEQGPVITLIPGNEKMRKMIKAIEVHLARDLQATQRVVLRENNGDYTDIRFYDQTVNREFPPRTFDRNTPLDLESVRQAVAKTPRS